jgi:NAD(P)-dependent dehydrogenase (short-subunit alcohol dehydrogenase family)
VDRDTENGALRAAQIRKETGDSGVEFLPADLSSQKEIRSLAEDIGKKHPRLHILVNNPGAMFPERRESADGIEMTFALNYLGFSLLSNLLLDALKAGAPARIVNTSSRSHVRARIHFDDLEYRSK